VVHVHHSPILSRSVCVIGSALQSSSKLSSHKDTGVRSSCFEWEEWRWVWLIPVPFLIIEIYEEPAHMMMQKTALWSIRPKDIMVSLFSLDVVSRENYTGFWQKKTMSRPTWASCGIFIGKTDEMSSTLHLMHNSFSFDKPSRISELFWDKN
jgi:hypothetical protein